MESNWPFEPGFVMFIYNSIAYLAENAGLVEKTELSVAEPMTLHGFQAGLESVFNGPGYENEKKSKQFREDNIKSAKLFGKF